MSPIESVLVLVPRRGCLSLGGRAGDAGAAVRSAALFEEMTVGAADAAVLSIVK
ncbi:hypothetical protein ACIQ6K_00025 [Streptomyces sp. NPDC096354]|uniref:hypothetical protein n=1 Tax=Streptomyces sp. NPDC096354 TaxID=3366088 RepID=UPI0037F184F5